MNTGFSRARYISFLLVICLVTVFSLPHVEIFAEVKNITLSGDKQRDVYTDFSREEGYGYGKNEIKSSGEYFEKDGYWVNYVGCSDDTLWVYDSKAAIMFDTSEVFGNVISATLEIYVVDCVGEPYVNLYGTDDDFVEGDDRSTFPSYKESDMIVDGDTDIETGEWKTFDVTSFVKEKVDGYSPYVTFVLTGNEYTPLEDHYFTFVSDEEVSGNSPILRLEIEPTAPGAPRNVSAEEGNGKATVSFEAPISNGGEEITEYIVTPYEGDTALSDKSAIGTASPIEVTGLTNGTEYTFKVQAKNSVGIGEESDASGPVTPDTFPGAPTEVSAVAGCEKATITFTEPVNEGSAIKEYKVIPYIGAEEQTEKIATGTGSPITVTGLTGGKTYTFKVSAINGKGEGPKSEASEEVTVTGLPGKPTIVSATRGDGQVEVAFTPPASDGGSEITGYKVTPYEGTTALTSKAVTGESSPITVTGLTNGTAYTFKVTAINGEGEGPESDPSEAVRPATVPGAPTGVTAQRGDGEATVTFTAPASNGGSAIEFYRVTPYQADVPLSEKAVEGTGTSITVTGLTNGIEYTFKVIAKNDVGESEESEASNPVTPVSITIPVVETGDAVNITGDGAKLTGKVNPNNADTTVTFEYGLTTTYGETVTANQSPVTGDTDTAVSYDLTGLTPNTTYHYRIIGENVKGKANGDDKTFITSKIAPTVTTSEASSVTTTGATLNGTVNANNDETKVIIEYGLTEAYGTIVTADPSSVTGVTDTAVSYDLTGLISNTTYHYRVVGTNTAGTTNGSDQTFKTLAVSPTVTTDSASNISATGATLNGTVKANNASTTVTFEYGPTPSYGLTVTADPSPVIGDTDTAVSYTLTGLTPNTTYHYRVKGSSTGGTTYGEDETFTTLKTPPSVTTGEATSVTKTGAILNGTVNANNAAIEVYIEYGTTDGYGSKVSTSPDTVAGVIETEVSCELTGLTSNTTYHYRVVAKNDAEQITYGEGHTFTTLAEAPVVTTDAPSDITATEATLKGTVNAKTAATTVTFEYGNTETYGLEATATPSPVTGDTDTVVSYTLTGLTPNTTYHYRVKGENTGGTTYGEDETFTTLKTPPTVTTGETTNVTKTGAILNGAVNGHNADTEVYIEYGTTTAYGSKISATPSLITGDTPKDISCTLTGLTPNTTYHYRIVAKNDADQITYGEGENFTTLAEPPKVTTGAPSDILATSATLKGTVNANTASTTVTFEYGTTASYGLTVTADQSPVTGFEDTAVSCALTGLTANTTYHYRVVGTNTGGTTHGEDQTFTTPKLPVIPTKPTVMTTAASNVAVATATLNGTVNANNAPTVVTFEYGLTTAYGSTATANQSPVTGNMSTAVNADIAGLTPNTTYHYRVVGINEKGLVTGEDKTFKTLQTPVVPQKPTVVTGVASNVARATATLNGTVNANNADTIVTFEYGLTTAYGKTATAIQSPVTGNLSTAVSANIAGLEPNTTYHYRVVGVNEKGLVSGVDRTFITSATSGGSNGGGSPSSKTQGKSQNDTLNVSINGNKTLSSLVRQEKDGEETVTTVTVDEKALLENLKKQGENPLITIPVDSTSDKVQGNFSAYAIQQMGAKGAIVEFMTSTGSYTIPVSQLATSEVFSSLGENIDLKDITISIEIAKSSEDEIKKVEALVSKLQCNRVTLPMGFSLRASYQDRSVKISKFNSYVVRSIKLPQNINLGITLTGVKIGPNNTLSPVPTRVEKIGNEYFAQISSLEASGTYCIVSKPIYFVDVKGNWAEEAIYDMGARMIIGGTGNNRFEPNREITRAEFATIIVKALGLEPISGNSSFVDVKSDAWYSTFIEAAAAYGLISGYGDNTFKPSDSITREHAVSIIVRAAKLAGLNVEESQFQAAKGVEGNITRAEVAQLVRELLRRARLI